MIRNSIRPLTGLVAAAALLALAAAPTLAGEKKSDTKTYQQSHYPRYVVNPPLSDATIEKRRKGYFVGTAASGNVSWHVPNAKEVAALERRRAGRLIAEYNY